MMYYIRDMETGEIVDKTETLEEALKKLKVEAVEYWR